ncbi:MAG: hypothetical protein HY268_08695 [Deltaproteobacteria bacterium]|nr:hypothetical protein [Deltaproteobacteria bacterium]
MEQVLISLNVLVTIAGFAFMTWTLRQDRREARTLLERIDANTVGVAEHTRHLAELVAQNGSALARVEILTQQILTRMAQEGQAH